MALLEELREAVVTGQAKVAVAKVTEGLAEGMPAATLLQDGLITAMGRVGELYEQGDFYVPEMLVAANAMTEALAVLKPELVSEGAPEGATIAIGTVKGDLHDIGKNLVAMMLQGAGFQIVDLGVDVSSERFVQAIRDGADVVGMSALLTTTMVEMEQNIAAIAEAGLRERAGSSSAARRSPPSTRRRSERTASRRTRRARCAGCRSCWPPRQPL